MAKNRYFTIFPLSFSANGSIQRGQVAMYQFINLSNVPVLINNAIFLDRYFTGTFGAPTVVPGSNNQWQSPMQNNEFDETMYSWVFLDSYYAGVTPYHKVEVIMKRFAREEC